MGRILVIENDLALKETICDVLLTKGHEVQSASNGLDGLLLARKQQLDLVICDINMPLMNGFETVKKFRRSKRNSLVPFLFLSAMTGMDYLRKGMDLGADDYMTKPFENLHLLSAVDRLLKKYSKFKDHFQKEHTVTVGEALDKFKGKVRDKIKHHIQSMENAKRVQSSILPDREELNTYFEKYGLFHLSKEMVSGDFYWAKEMDGKKIVAVGDCTGHGMPAALMTMVCSNMLSISVEKYGLRNPKEILEKTNELVIDYMHSNNTMLNNGMDIALCSIDYDNSHLLFAGAKRPLYFKSDQQLAITENISCYDLNRSALYRYKGGSGSIGTENCTESIVEYKINFKEGDTIYLCSDGFFDQFGGQMDKKYNFKRFTQLLDRINDLPIQAQEEELKRSFVNWKGEFEQTDDVTVLFIAF